MRQDSQLAARLQVVGAAVLFSTGAAVVKAISLTGWQVAGLRSGIACLALVIMMPAARRRWTWRTLLVGLAYAAALISYVLANKLTTAANTIFLYSTAPLHILLLGPLLLKEPVGRRDLLFMVAMGLGLALFFVEIEAPRATATDPVAGNVLALSGGFFWALTVVGLRWLNRRGPEGGSSESAVAAGNLLAFLICLVPGLPLAGSGLGDWLLVSYLGLVQVGLAYLLFTRGLRRVTALEGSLLVLLEPVLNPFWAWWMHGETPGSWAILGGAVILSAIAVRALSAQVRSRGRPGNAGSGGAGGPGSLEA